jgi:hypothetical protein
MHSRVVVTDRNVADASQAFESAMATLGGTNISRLPNGFSVQRVGGSLFEATGTAALTPLDATRTRIDVVVPMPTNSKIIAIPCWIAAAIVLAIGFTLPPTAAWWINSVFIACMLGGLIAQSAGELASVELCWMIIAGFMPCSARPISVVATPASTPATVDVTDQLKTLAQLHRDGILTDAEFEAKKAELLKRM